MKLVYEDIDDKAFLSLLNILKCARMALISSLYLPEKTFFPHVIYTLLCENRS